jgi:hypothetical protein
MTLFRPNCPYLLAPQPVTAEDGIEGTKSLKHDLLILDGSSEPLDEDVVEDPAFPVHADSNVMVLKNGRGVSAGRLRSLVGVENVRGTDSERFLKRHQR